MRSLPQNFLLLNKNNEKSEKKLRRKKRKTCEGHTGLIILILIFRAWTLNLFQGGQNVTFL